jgi:hypothetical protein
VILGCVSPQLLSMFFLFWAIWWPTPSTPATYRFAVIGTAVLIGLSLLVLYLLLRRNVALAIGILRAPFIRLTVTDRRVLWHVPWSSVPLMEIGAARVVGGILGSIDRRGAGSAAMMLRDGDPSADFDGNIHFDRLPNVEGFLEALSKLRH